MTFGDFLRQRFGEGWVLAPRLTPRLRERGYTVAISRVLYKKLEREWEIQTYGAPLASLQAAAPAMLAALRHAEPTLVAYTDHGHPDHPQTWVLKAVREAIAKAEGRQP